MRLKTDGEKARADAFEAAFKSLEIKDEGIKGAYFQLLASSFDLERAHFLAQWREPLTIEIEPWLRAFGLLGNDGFGLIRIEQKRIDALPVEALNNPVYVASIYGSSDGKSGPMLIDGWHRAVWAHRLGKKELPAILFSPIETMWIMHELNIYVQP